MRVLQQVPGYRKLALPPWFWCCEAMAVQWWKIYGNETGYKLRVIENIGNLDELVVSLNCCDGQIGNDGHNR